MVDETLLNAVKLAVQQSVEELLATGCRLAGYVLMTDDDLGSVFAAAITEEELAASSDEDLLFTSSEWPHEVHGARFNAISRSLFGRAHESDAAFEEHVEVSFETLVEALAQLRVEGLFAPSVFLSVGSTDPGPHLETLEAGSIRRLDDQALVDARERFIAKWSRESS